MPRATRSANAPKSDSKNIKKESPQKPESKSRRRSGVSVLPQPETPPSRSLRKREVCKAEEIPTSSPESVGKSGPSKRRRISSPASLETSKNSIKSDLHEVNNREATILQQKTSPSTHVKSSGRKRKVATPTNLDSSNDESIPITKPSAKKGKTFDETNLSPMVIVSPLKRNLSILNDDNGYLLKSNPTPTKNTNCLPDSSFDKNNTENAVQSSSPKTSTTVIVSNGDAHVLPWKLAENESLTLATTTVSKSLTEKKKDSPHLPTKQELATTQRRKLLQQVDHYDLSDSMITSKVLLGWPAVDVVPFSNPPTQLEAIKSLNRVWVNETPSSINGDIISNRTSPIPLKQLMINDPPGLDQSTTPTAAFCVASFSLSMSHSISSQNQIQIDEHCNIVREIEVINPDIFCVKNALTAYANDLLLPELFKLGYKSSAFNPEMDNMVQQSFICYNINVFSEISVHCVPVLQYSRTLASQSAYPQNWRDSLYRSLSKSAYTEYSSSGLGPQLIVSVLRHIESDSVILFSCLTETVSQSTFINHPEVTSSQSVTPSTVSLAPSCPNLVNPLADKTCDLVPQTSSSLSCSQWNCIPYFSVLAGAGTTTVSTSKPGFSAFTSSEWCPPALHCRPDLAAITATGALWALQKIWEEVSEPSSSLHTNGLSRNPSLQNGFSHNEVLIEPSSFRWIMCANLEATPGSPVYQIFQDGYPSDTSLERLRALRNVHLEGHDFMDSTSLIDLMWHAFQHPCSDVVSCYKSVMGREPPFTRIAKLPDDYTKLIPGRCVDYIFCSSSTLQPKSVLIPPCRSILEPTLTSRCVNHLPSDVTKTSLPLAARLSFNSAVY